MNEIETAEFQASLSGRGLEAGEPVSLARGLSASPAEVWTMISSPGQLDKYHPYCRRNEVIRWPGRGSRDRVIYHSGLAMERDFMSWVDGRGYDLQIGPAPRKTSWISWKIAALGETGSELSITVTPLLESHLLPATKRYFTETYYGKSIEVYLDHLLRGADHFLSTGRTVSARHFGTHPVYAP
jgi:hypothetical protein